MQADERSYVVLARPSAVDPADVVAGERFVRRRVATRAARAAHAAVGDAVEG